MNLKQILERLRNTKKDHYSRGGEDAKEEGKSSYGWACRAAGVDDAIQLIERDGPGPCYECACLRDRLKNASVTELAASNLNVKHWADGWERRALKAEAECEKLREIPPRVIHSDYVLPYIKPPSDPQLQEAQAYIQTLLSSRAALSSQEQRTRDECNRLRGQILQFKSLLDSAESLLCNCQPYAHTLCPPQDWVKVLKDWRDEKHRLSPDGPERWHGDSTISPEGKI